MSRNRQVSDGTIHSILGGLAVVVIALLYQIEKGIRELRAKVKQMKIDLIHEHRVVLGG